MDCFLPALALTTYLKMGKEIKGQEDTREDPFAQDTEKTNAADTKQATYNVSN